MKAKELKTILEEHPEANVLVMKNEDYDDKISHVTPYTDSEGNVVIQFWR